MTSSEVEQCQATLEKCPKGHEMKTCIMVDDVEGRICKQCGEGTFQPEEDVFGDRCLMKRTCARFRMVYKTKGDINVDAECMCDPGYHFETKDHRACVPNMVCPKGFEQGVYGVCDDCKQKGMYSDSADMIGRCQPLTDCDKLSRCTLENSDGTTDSTCQQVKL